MPTRELASTSAFPSLFEDFFKPWSQWVDDSRITGRVKTMPAVNISENKNHYTVKVAAPGMKKEDFQIDIEGNMLNIHSEKEERKEEKDEKFTRKEYSYSSFSRSFSLPEDVKQEDNKARYENGELNITLPRKEDGRKSEANLRIAVK